MGGYAAALERKWNREDEERQIRVNDLLSKRKQLSDVIPMLTGNEREQAKNALQEVNVGIGNIYHPEHNPGALAKDWDKIKHWFFGTKPPAPVLTKSATQPGTPETSVTLGGQTVTMPATPAYQTVGENQAAMTPQQRDRTARIDAARKQTDLDIAAAGLSPQQQAAVDNQKLAAAVEGKMQILDKMMGPNWDPNQREETKNALLTAQLGANLKEKYFTQIITTKDSAGREHYYRVPMQPGAEPEEIGFNGQDVVQKAKGQQGLRFDKITGQVWDPASGQRYNENDPKNPPEVQAMFGGYRKMLNEQQKFQLELTATRGAAYNATRWFNVYDTANGNAPAIIRADQMSKEPGRYIPITGSDKAIAAVNLMEDLKGTSQLTRQAINNLKEDFPLDMKAKIAVALTADDHGAAFNALSSQLLGTLTDDQWQFLVRARQLTENAMSMRQILGAGQGSEDVRTAIQATLPSLLSPNRKFALMQLDAFDQTLERLHRGVRNVPLNNQPWNVQPPQGGQGQKTVRLADAVALYKKMHPDKTNVTEAEVIDDLNKHHQAWVR